MIGLYLFLRTFLLAILIICGLNIAKSKSNKSYWINAAIVMIIFTLIEGLRYNRGVDYKGYKYTYDHNIDIYEPLFTAINKLFLYLDLPFYYPLMAYNLIIILGLIILLKNYKKLALYALPLFFIINEAAIENLIRQYTAIGFIFISLSYAGINWKKYALFSICAALIHSSSIVLIPFCILLSTLKLPKSNPNILLIIYCGVFFLWKTTYFTSMLPYIEQINLSGSNFNNYLENSERWFTKEEGGLGFNFSFIQTIRYFIRDTILIYLGSQLSNKIKRFSLFFYLFYIGLLLTWMAEDIEVILRISKYFYLMQFFVAAMVIYRYKRVDISKFYIYFLLINYAYEFTYKISTLSNPNMCKFIWDAPLGTFT